MGKKAYVRCIILLFAINVLSYGGGRTVIIDTDAAPDDMRAICMLLSREDIRVVAITTSDGALDPQTAARKVKALLHVLDRDDIPVGVGIACITHKPPFRDFCGSFYWGEEQAVEIGKFHTAKRLLRETISKADEVTMICLGPLTNMAGLIKNPYWEKVKEVFWYSSFGTSNQEHCMNYMADTVSAQKVIYSGVKLKIVSNLGNEDALFNMEMLTGICEADNAFAEIVCASHNKKEVIETRINNGHFKLWDDLVALFFLYPGFFEEIALFDKLPVYRVSGYDAGKTKSAIKDVFAIKVIHTHVVFEEFPCQPEHFREDVAPYVEQIIEKHGEDEWIACLITHEMHGHLGLYSLMGAKMGIKAREYFNVGIDKLEVISLAGSNPPISCLNDGLQVSTGATLGQGTISLADVFPPEPAAIFKLGEKQIKIVIKPEFRKKFKTDIEDALLQYDLSQEGYWQLVRELAIRYWLELDRDEIFIIEEIK